jgi:hypothetical protein
LTTSIKPGIFIQKKLFKSGIERLLRSSATSKEERTMVGERRGEGVEDVIIMASVPIFIAKYGVDFSHCRKFALIGLSELAILEVDLIELARVKGSPEFRHMTHINVKVVFVFSMVNLIEVTQHNPSSAKRRL